MIWNTPSRINYLSFFICYLETDDAYIVSKLYNGTLKWLPFSITLPTSNLHYFKKRKYKFKFISNFYSTANEELKSPLEEE